MDENTETPGGCDPAQGNSCNCMNLCTTCHCNGGPDQTQVESILFDLSNNTAKSALIIQAIYLDTVIETPDQLLVVDGDEEILFSEILKNDPSLLPQLIKERTEVYRQLGLELSNA
jgi:hypothetical protein